MGPDDPMFDLYPIDTPERLSWIPGKVHMDYDDEEFEYFVDQCPKDQHDRLIEQISKRKKSIKQMDE